MELAIQNRGPLKRLESQINLIVKYKMSQFTASWSFSSPYKRSLHKKSGLSGIGFISSVRRLSNHGIM